MDVKNKMSCDVLVIGGGNAGLIAAIEAKNRGPKVQVIEKAPKKSRGGNSRISGGLFRTASEGTKDYLPLLDQTTLPKGVIDIDIPVLMISNSDIDLKNPKKFLLVKTAPVPELWAPLVDMVPMQLTGFLLARRLGLEPGKLIISTYVTSVE